MLAMVCFDVVGRDATVGLAAQAGQLELNVMMPAVAHALLPGLDYLAAALKAFRTRCIEGLRADAARCEAYAHRSPQLVTALVPRLGYARAAELAKRAVAEGRAIGEVAVEEGLLTEEEAKDALNPLALTEPSRQG
jgi:fumarate hydratase, class II